MCLTFVSHSRTWMNTFRFIRLRHSMFIWEICWGERVFSADKRIIVGVMCTCLVYKRTVCVHKMRRKRKKRLTADKHMIMWRMWCMYKQYLYMRCVGQFFLQQTNNNEFMRLEILLNLGIWLPKVYHFSVLKYVVAVMYVRFGHSTVCCSSLHYSPRMRL